MTTSTLGSQIELKGVSCTAGVQEQSEQNPHDPKRMRELITNGISITVGANHELIWTRQELESLNTSGDPDLKSHVEILLMRLRGPNLKSQ